jgi:chemotaxis protein CheD
VLATYALGSCIGLAVYDRHAMVGGLLHFMLPDSALDSARARQNPYVFADVGVPKLIQLVCAQGAGHGRLVARAAGGACFVDPHAIFDIGKRNYLALRKVLWKEGVLLAAEACGGTESRAMRLEIASGRLWLHEGSTERELSPL